MKKVISVDEYIESFPLKAQGTLKAIRKTIQKLVPKAKEKISYGIPSFHLNGYLIYYAAYKNHIAFYPIPRGDDLFNKKIAPYVSGKGTVKFPIDKKIPFNLVEQMVKFRQKDNLEKLKLKNNSK